MPDAPNPITSPPALPWQPYNAAAPEEQESSADAETVYDELSEGGGNGNPWHKVADGGASNPAGVSQGTWPGNGASGDGGWQNV